MDVSWRVLRLTDQDKPPMCTPPLRHLQTFTSAGGDNEWETFTLSQPTDVIGGFEIFAVSGPTFASVPDYPALRVVDFQVVGEPEDNGPGYFNVRTSYVSSTCWYRIGTSFGFETLCSLRYTRAFHFWISLHEL